MTRMPTNRWRAGIIHMEMARPAKGLRTYSQGERVDSPGLDWKILSR